MRCRAWLEKKSRFCRNHATGLFCHVHNHYRPYPAVLCKLPVQLIQQIHSHLTCEGGHNMRCAARALHDNLCAKPFSLSKEYEYFRSFLDRERISSRMMKTASKRLSQLPAPCRRTIEEYAVCKGFPMSSNRTRQGLTRYLGMSADDELCRIMFR